MAVIQAFRSRLQGAKEALCQDVTAGAEALAKEVTIPRVICLMVFLIWGGFNQARDYQLSTEICNLQMQLQDQQKTHPTETFQGCLYRLGGR